MPKTDKSRKTGPRWGFTHRVMIWLIGSIIDVVWIARTGFEGAKTEQLVLMGYVVYGVLSLVVILFSTIILSLRKERKTTEDRFFTDISMDIALVMLIIIGFRINEMYLPSLTDVTSILYNALIIVNAIAVFFISRIVLRVIGIRLVKACILFVFIATLISSQPIQIRPDLQTKGSMYRPNIVLVTLDTVRADHLGACGYDRDTSPNFDLFASDNHLFTNIRTPMPLTSPSHASLFSGFMPNEHGVFTNISDYPAKPDYVTIAEDFDESGYMTVGFPAAVHMGRDFNFNRGFDFYNQSTMLTNFPYGQSCYQLAPVAIISRLGLLQETFLARGSGQVNKAFSIWLENYSGRFTESGNRIPVPPFFAWLHYFDAHSPYQPPEDYWRQFDPDYSGPVTGSQEECDEINAQLQNYIDATSLPDGYTRADIDNLVARYDGEIRRVDESLGELFNELRRLGLWEDTVIILVSDHGEGMYDDGYFGHNFTLKEYEIKLACAIKGPDIISADNEMLSITDLTDYMRYIGAGLDASQCRLTMPSGTEDPDENPYTSMVFLKSHCWIDTPYKLIRTYEGEGSGISYSLYDYIADPLEQNDLFSAGDGRSDSMKNTLLEWLEINHADFLELLSNERTREDIDPATLEMLRSLGYIY